MFQYKFKLFSISLVFVWIILFVKNIDIPVYLGPDPVFVGWKRLLSYGNLIALVSFIMFIVALLAWHQLNHRLKGSPSTLKTRISSVHDRSFDFVNTLATVTTLVSIILVPTDTLREFLIFMLLMAAITVCYLKTNLYYSNPIFAALGYRLYTIKVESIAIPDDSIVIVRNQIRLGDYIRCFHISDNVYFLVK